MTQICDRCKVEEEVLHTIRMACSYNMFDLDLQFGVEKIDKTKFYTLRVCKHCRGDWICAIRDLFHDKKSGEVLI